MPWVYLRLGQCLFLLGPPVRVENNLKPPRIYITLMNEQTHIIIRNYLGLLVTSPASGPSKSVVNACIHSQFASCRLVGE